MTYLDKMFKNPAWVHPRNALTELAIITDMCCCEEAFIGAVPPKECDLGRSLDKCAHCWKRELPPKTRTEQFREITEKMAAVYAAKNHDYGGSFTNTRQKFPAAILIRLNDKLSRLETLLASDSAQVKDESINDTLLDLANYAVMELVERTMEESE